MPTFNNLATSGMLAILLAPIAWAQQVTLDVPAELIVGQAFKIV